MWTKIRAQLAASAIDISLLRNNKNLAILFYSGLISRLGSMITYVALPFQVKELTNSYLAVGLMGAAELIPLIIFGLYGGVLADALDRKKLIFIGEASALFLSVVLLINSQLANPQLWLLYLVAAAFSAVNGITSPSYNAVIPQIVAHDDLPKASALMGLRWQVAVITGPAAGGFIISYWGVGTGYLFDVITYCISLLLLFQLGTLARGAKRTPPSVSALVDGMRYAVKRQDLMGTYLIDLAAMFFAMPTALFPFWAESLGAPSALGLLYSAGTVGALLVTLTSGWTLRIHNHGKAIIYSALAWGLAIALAGLIDSLGSTLPHGRRWRRPCQRYLPVDNLESNYPARTSRPTCRYRSSLLHRRSYWRSASRRWNGSDYWVARGNCRWRSALHRRSRSYLCFPSKIS